MSFTDLIRPQDWLHRLYDSTVSSEQLSFFVFSFYPTIGSRPSDHYFRSVCLFVCLCRVFLSRLWSDCDQTRTYVICLGL